MDYDDEPTGMTDEEYRDTLRGPATGRLFVDKLLLSFIDAYSEPSKDAIKSDRRREKRLLAAKKSLFGYASKPGTYEIQDDRALFRMATEHFRDESRAGMIKMGFVNAQESNSKQPFCPRSIRELARDAAKSCLGNSDDSTVDRLRKKFSKNRDKFLNIAEHQDGVVETLEFNALDRIRNVLDPFGIDMDLTKSSK